MSFLAGLAHEFRSECTQGECLLDSLASLFGEMGVRMHGGHVCRIGHFRGAEPCNIGPTEQVASDLDEHRRSEDDYSRVRLIRELLRESLEQALRFSSRNA
jgi:hypothetical protein